MGLLDEMLRAGNVAKGMAQPLSTVNKGPCLRLVRNSLSLTKQHVRAGWVPRCETSKKSFRRPAADTCMLKVHQENPSGIQSIMVVMQLAR